MATRTHEQTINTALGEVLQDLGRYWTIRSEHVGRIFDEGGRPDILIEKADGWPIVVEAEVGNHRQAEIEAQSRLGNHLTASAEVINASVALVYPDALRGHHGAALRAELSGVTFEYVLYTLGADGETQRFPAAGWLIGAVEELAILLHRSSVPAWRVEALADALEAGVIRAEGSFSASHAHGSNLGATIAASLGQTDDEAGQTRRMAMTVIVDAFIFHAALAEAEMSVPDLQTGTARSVRSPGEFRVHAAFQPTALLDEWHNILQVNYWPIFHTASEIVRVLPPRTANAILEILWQTAESLITGGVTKSHDLTGVVFQRLIADRKFLATYYTGPAGAAFLAALAIPIDRSLTGESWSDGEALGALRIGDFACGTGTLLSTAYQRVSLLHEMSGGDPKALHPLLMEHGLVGLDVLTVAVHLTAAMLAGSHPDTPFAGECLLTMPYGQYDWGVCLGSLDLLQEQTSFEVIQAAARTAGGLGSGEVRDLVHRIGHGEFDLVIMNPPFTRHGAHEGDRTETHNPAFAAFGATEDEQNLLARHLQRISRGGAGHGHAGLASYFVDLAHAKAAPGGKVALVLPMSALSGGSWEGVRTLWRREYSQMIVATIAEAGSHSRAFSADTGMAECIFVGTKLSGASEPRAVFVVLSGQPRDTLQGELIAQAVTRLIDTGGIRSLESGPFGGSRICLGDSVVGQAIECPLPEAGAWQMAGISDVSLAQTAYQLTRGQLWIEGMPQAHVPQVPVVETADVIERIGPHHLDITGAQVKGDGLPQGPFTKIVGERRGAAYPALWAHDSSRERTLFVSPDSHLQIREVSGTVPTALSSRAETRWATATRAHYNSDLQFNSQSLIIAMTEQPTIGGRAWPSVVFGNRDFEFAYALWCNSTLGLLCHWWMANKTQSGRGTTTVTGIPSIHTIDVNALSVAQHSAAREALEAMSELRFLPFDQIDEDPARAELDRRLLVDVLGLDPSICDDDGPMQRLRTKLAAEPQIHGNKQTRLIFSGIEENNVRRTAPRA